MHLLFLLSLLSHLSLRHLSSANVSEDSAATINEDDDTAVTTTTTITTSKDHKINNLVRNPSIEHFDDLTLKPLWWQPFINDYTMTSGRKSHSGKHSLTFNLYRSTWVGCGQLVWIHQTIAKDLELSA